MPREPEYHGEYDDLVQPEDAVEHRLAMEQGASYMIPQGTLIHCTLRQSLPRWPPIRTRVKGRGRALCRFLADQVRPVMA